MTESASDSRVWTWAVLDTPIGPLLLGATEQGLVSVVFHADERTAAASVERLTRRLGSPPVAPGREGVPEAQGVPEAKGDRAPKDDASAGDRAVGDPSAGAASAHLAEAIRQLTAYFSGKARTFTVPLDWSLTTGFNRRVLRALAAHVPYGTVVGYQDLADRIAEPGAARAVGMAMGGNPLPVVVPCHRVVESDGGIGGFGGGLETKRLLLALEGVLPQPLF
ncbi:methylated-DNA--[protein]-cysteine S-methyltransferase [Streptomyces sp. LX-29]|uniref:methylated-DNA--[protein]-cysteine S-methyltransferase n=1 Tax=Streptomyces sp. LX-29 TaxID=2900152 RepID=UPI00240E860A|nr:methylated-DNA--[protein]-cysteine S-methyltransferase [Streptomyces sp. LX-29]WFB10112.1 methylated-DNA--[protein]-cysteine S-methyltransferase [Streptomyces sp. LX-29]